MDSDPDMVDLIANGLWNVLIILAFLLLTCLVLKDLKSVRDRLASILESVDKTIHAKRRHPQGYPLFVGRETLRLFQRLWLWVTVLVAPLGSFAAIFSGGRNSIEKLRPEALELKILLLKVELGWWPLIFLGLGFAAYVVTQWHIGRFNSWLDGHSP